MLTKNVIYISKAYLFQILDRDHYNICYDCFQSASAAYKFYLQAKRSHEILDFYTDQLLKNIEDLEITEADSKQLLCIPLPVFIPEVSVFDYGLDSIGTRHMGDDYDGTTGTTNMVADDVVMVVQDDQTLLSVEDEPLQEVKLQEQSDDENVLMIVNEKTRKKRVPMIYVSCLHCPVKYRFVTKLKIHEKKMHNADVYYCQVSSLNGKK